MDKHDVNMKAEGRNHYTILYILQYIIAIVNLMLLQSN